jgi:hypothetical protein
VYKTFSTDGGTSSADPMDPTEAMDPADLLDGIDPVETFGSYQNLIKKDDNRFKNIFSNRKNGAVRTYHSMRNINNYTNINNSNNNMHSHNDHLSKGNANNALYDNRNETKLNSFKIDRNKNIIPQRRLFSTMCRSTTHLDPDHAHIQHAPSNPLIRPPSDPHAQPPSESTLIPNLQNTENEKDMKIITYSSSYTIVPTYECFNVCTYCNFRYICKFIYTCMYMYINRNHFL